MHFTSPNAVGRQLAITIEPHGRHGKFAARLLDGEIIAISVQPFIASARALLGRGYPADTLLLMRHRDSATVALKGRIGAVAPLEVRETGHGPRLVRTRKFPPPAAADDELDEGECREAAE
jgi:hypothetical protein